MEWQNYILHTSPSNFYSKHSGHLNDNDIYSPFLFRCFKLSPFNKIRSYRPKKSKASNYDTAGNESSNWHDQILNDVFSIF